jgi:hypothetical protein
MEGLNVHQRLTYALATVAVIRGLKLKGQTMRYNELARAIGLLQEGEPWHIRYRTFITDILCIAAAVENQAGPSRGGADPLPYESIVNEDGEPGSGFLKTSRITRTG